MRKLALLQRQIAWVCRLLSTALPSADTHALTLKLLNHSGEILHRSWVTNIAGSARVTSAASCHTQRGPLEDLKPLSCHRERETEKPMGESLSSVRNSEVSLDDLFLLSSTFPSYIEETNLCIARTYAVRSSDCSGASPQVRSILAALLVLLHL